MTNYKDVFSLAQEKGYKTVFFKHENIFKGQPETIKKTALLELTLMQKWLRDEYGIEVYARPVCVLGKKVYRAVIVNTSKIDSDSFHEDSVMYTANFLENGYILKNEEALLHGIHEALKLLP